MVGDHYSRKVFPGPDCLMWQPSQRTLLPAAQLCLLPDMDTTSQAQAKLHHIQKTFPENVLIYRLPFVTDSITSQIFRIKKKKRLRG